MQYRTDFSPYRERPKLTCALGTDDAKHRRHRQDRLQLSFGPRHKIASRNSSTHSRHASARASNAQHLFCSALVVPKKPRQKLTSPRASRLPREWRTTRPVMRPGIPPSFLHLPLSRCNTCSVLRREVLEEHLTESFWINAMCHWFSAIHTEHRLRRRHADRR